MGGVNFEAIQNPVSQIWKQVPVGFLGSTFNASQSIIGTADGRNPAPADMENMPF